MSDGKSKCVVTAADPHRARAATVRTVSASAACWCASLPRTCEMAPEANSGALQMAAASQCQAGKVETRAAGAATKGREPHMRNCVLAAAIAAASLLTSGSGWAFECRADGCACEGEPDCKAMFASDQCEPGTEQQWAMPCVGANNPYGSCKPSATAICDIDGTDSSRTGGKGTASTGLWLR
jgi:hypothetical protein